MLRKQKTSEETQKQVSDCNISNKSFNEVFTQRTQKDRKWVESISPC